ARRHHASLCLAGHHLRPRRAWSSSGIARETIMTIVNQLLSGNRSVITAGASGIGRAIADTLIANGARVAICDIADEFLTDFKKAHPEMPALKADVANDTDVAALFNEAERTLGGV